MSKAEERALEAYPSTLHYWNAEPDRNAEAREFYKQGYHQAEKDLELTWEDIKQICDIAFEEACRLQRNMKSSHIYKEQYYQEVLKQFNEQRNDRH